MDLLDESGSDADAPGSADDASNSSDDEGGRADPYPYQGIYKSARDMEELMSMNELEREDILARRRDEIQKRRQKYELAALFKAQKAAAGATKKKRVVRGGRGRGRGGSDESEESEEDEEEEEEEEGSDYDLYGGSGAASAAKSRKKKLSGQTDAKSAKLSELRKKRKEKAAGVSSRKVESDDDLGGSPVKGARGGRRGYASDSASDVSYSDYSEDGEPSYSRGKRTTAAAAGGDSSEPPSVSDLNAARITRELVESRLYAPRWREILIGSFFRFSWGTRPIPPSTTNPRGGSETIYRIHQVTDIIEKPGKFYDLSEDRSGRWCNVFLVFEHDGNEHEAKLNLLSRGDFTESERERFMAWLKASKQRIPKKASVVRKADELENFFTSPLTEADIKKMLDHKKKIRAEAVSVMGKSALGAGVESPRTGGTPGNATPTLGAGRNGNGEAQVQSLEARLAAVNERNRALDRSKMSDVERKARSTKAAALQAAKAQGAENKPTEAEAEKEAVQGGVELTNVKPGLSGMGNGFVAVKNFATTVEVDLGDF